MRGKKNDCMTATINGRQRRLRLCSPNAPAPVYHHHHFLCRESIVKCLKSYCCPWCFLILNDFWASVGIVTGVDASQNLQSIVCSAPPKCCHRHRLHEEERRCCSLPGANLVLVHQLPGRLQCAATCLWATSVQVEILQKWKVASPFTSKQLEDQFLGQNIKKNNVRNKNICILVKVTQGISCFRLPLMMATCVM